MLPAWKWVPVHHASGSYYAVAVDSGKTIYLLHNNEPPSLSGATILLLLLKQKTKKNVCLQVGIPGQSGPLILPSLTTSRPNVFSESALPRPPPNLSFFFSSQPNIEGKRVYNASRWALARPLPGTTTVFLLFLALFLLPEEEKAQQAWRYQSKPIDYILKYLFR